MMKKVIETDKAPKGTGPYSQAIIAGNFVFVAGQGPLHPKTHEVIGKDIIEQTRFTLANIKNILEAAGSGLDKVVKVNAYLADINDYEKYNETYQEFFKKPYPARTTIGCVLTDIKVEIDVIAEK
jgi:2-iminobutanoate/2-iminopropanoate deaminase